jgi:hypothetical protein
MNRDEFRALANYLFAQHVRPLSPRRHSFHDDSYGPSLYPDARSLGRAASVIDLVSKHVFDDDDIYRSVTPERLRMTVGTVEDALSYHNNLAQESGFIDIMDSHLAVLLGGLSHEDLPSVDEEVLKALGSRDPKADLVAITTLVTATLFVRREDGQSASPIATLEHARERVMTARYEFEAWETSVRESAAPTVPPKKSRRWFKALGSILTGASLSTANILAACGIWPVALSPETQSFGAVASVSTGVGLVMVGVGEWRNE